MPASARPLPPPIRHAVFAALCGLAVFSLLVGSGLVRPVPGQAELERQITQRDDQRRALIESGVSPEAIEELDHRLTPMIDTTRRQTRTMRRAGLTGFFGSLLLLFALFWPRTRPSS